MASRRKASSPETHELNEFELIDRIASVLDRGDARFPLTIGDDAAVVHPRSGYELVWTIDALVEGVHFRREWLSAAELGRRALAVNLSDLAAMGASPLGALVSVAVPASWNSADIVAIHRGIGRCGSEFDCALLGGNIARTRGRSEGLELHVSVLGEVPAGKALLRSGARPGDELWVSGRVGEAHRGLRSLMGKGEAPKSAVTRWRKPLPRIALGEALRESGAVGTAIDLSDGLLADLGHVLKASGGLGAELDVSRLPVQREAKAAARSGDLAELEALLSGGEDYELLFIAPAAKAGVVESAARRARTPVTRIGRIAKEPGVVLWIGKGRAVECRGPGGWRHR